MGRVNQTEAARQQLAILSFLGEEREVSLARIAELLGISEDEAADQTMALACCTAGRDRLVEIYNDDERGTVVVYGALPELAHPVRLTASEARALETALDMAGVSADDPLRAKLHEAASAGDIDHDELDRIFSAVARNANGGVLGDLAFAVEQRHLVRFTHRNASTHLVRERLVEPYALALANGVWYLEGFCREADELRTFRVDGIADVCDLGPYPARTLRLEGRTSPTNLEGLPLATLEVDRADFEVGRYRWPGMEASNATPSAPDRIVVTVPYRDHLWLGRRIAARGASVTVLDPPELAEAAARIARAALAEAQSVWGD